MLEHQLPAIAEEAVVPLYELEAPSHASLSVYDSEATRPPLVTVSDYEPIISTYRQLREDNQQMSQYVQEIITRDIILKDQLERARSNCNAAEVGMALLWEVVRQQFEGSEDVATTAEILQFLSTRDLKVSFQILLLHL